MFELGKAGYFYTGKIITALIILAGLALFAFAFGIFMGVLGMTLFECRPLLIMLVLFAVVVAGTIIGD